MVHGCGGGKRGGGGRVGQNITEDEELGCKRKHIQGPYRTYYGLSEGANPYELQVAFQCLSASRIENLQWNGIC